MKYEQQDAKEVLSVTMQYLVEKPKRPGASPGRLGSLGRNMTTNPYSKCFYVLRITFS